MSVSAPAQVEALNGTIGKVVPTASSSSSTAAASSSSSSRRSARTAPPRMGLFDGLKKAFENEEFAEDDQRVRASHILAKGDDDVETISRAPLAPSSRKQLARRARSLSRALGAARSAWLCGWLCAWPMRGCVCVADAWLCGWPMRGCVCG